MAGRVWFSRGPRVSSTVAWPADFPAAILVVTHVGARKSLLPELLAKTSALPVRYAQDREPIRPGRILLAPPDLHMLVAITAGQAAKMVDKASMPPTEAPMTISDCTAAFLSGDSSDLDSAS